MHNNHISLRLNILFLLLLFSLLLLSSVGEDAIDPQHIRSQMITIMELDDFEDESDLAQRQKIIELGSSAYPVLVELLDETKEAVPVSRILGVFVEGKGDKQIAIEATKKLLKRNQGDSSPEIRISAVNTLAKIGSTSDASALIPFIGDSSEFVRVNVMRALSKMGGTNELIHIEQYLNSYKANASQDALQNDLSFKEGQLAVEIIKSRVAGQLTQ